MPNPQLEDGHTAIANEIIEALAGIRLSGEEWQVLLVILRKTYGWHKKSDEISLAQYQILTKLAISRICRTLKKLLTKRIIIVDKIGNKNSPNRYEFNKHYDQWNFPVRGKVIDKKGQKLLTKTTSTKTNIQKKEKKDKEINKEKKEINKENYGEFKNVKLAPEEYIKLVERYTEPAVKIMIERMSSYLAAHGDKYKSHYATAINWFGRDEPNSSLRNSFAAGRKSEYEH